MVEATHGALHEGGVSTTGHGLPVRTITVDDIKGALTKGVDDFQAMPTHTIFFGVIYAVLGLVLARFAFNYELFPLLFPLASGFALLGPFAALGLYDLSRRREQGLSTNWWRAFGVFRGPSTPAILLLGLVLAALFFLWLALAWSIFQATFGAPITSFGGFLGEVFTTGHGWAMLLLGNAVGALFALVVFAISVISFPLLLDRNVAFFDAVATSVRALVANPQPMLTWAGIVVAGLVVGSLPLFLGLAIILPILGHATWHLYRAVVPR